MNEILTYCFKLVLKYSTNCSCFFLKFINCSLNFVCGNFIVSMLLLTETGIYYDIDYHIHYLQCIRHTIDIIIANSFVHSQLDYCSSLYHALPDSQLKRLQQIQNARVIILILLSLQASHPHSISSLAMRTINQNLLQYSQSPWNHLFM